MKQLSSTALVDELKTLVLEERKLTTRILHYLREVETRRHYAELGYASLFDFAVRELGYSSDAAFRRISAMRLMKDVPELEAKLESGELTLATVAKAQSFFRAERKAAAIGGYKSAVAFTPERKRLVLDTLSHKSKRDAEAILVTLASSPQVTKSLLAEKQRPISSELIRLEITIDAKLKTKIDRLMSLLSHRNRDSSISGLLEILTEEALERHDPERIEARRIARESAARTAGVQPPSADPAESRSPILSQSHQVPQNNAETKPTIGTRPNPFQVPLCPGKAEPRHIPTPKINQTPRSRHIPNTVKRDVFIRDKGQCSHPGCTATRYLNYDHIEPYALGGAHSAENIRLLCHAHNQMRARLAFGEKTQFSSGQIE